MDCISYANKNRVNNMINRSQNICEKINIQIANRKHKKVIDFILIAMTSHFQDYFSHSNYCSLHFLRKENSKHFS